MIMFKGLKSGLKTKDELLDIKNSTSISTFLIGESLLKNLENNNIFYKYVKKLLKIRKNYQIAYKKIS